MYGCILVYVCELIVIIVSKTVGGSKQKLFINLTPTPEDGSTQQKKKQ